MLAVLVTGAEVTLGSLAGFLAVLGIAARQAVLLVSRFAHLRQHEGEPFGPELVARGTRERLVPIMTSALATGAALLPFAVLGSRAGFEIVHPLAVVVLGGLITATLLNLLVVPALYLLAGSRAGTGDLDVSPSTPPLPTPEPALTGAEPTATRQAKETFDAERQRRARPAARPEARPTVVWSGSRSSLPCRWPVVGRPRPPARPP